MNRRKRTLAITLLVLLLLFVPPFWITYREYRQARLDHALIEAIKTGNDQKALEALAEGASGEARNTGEPPTFPEALLHLWDCFRHPGQIKDKPDPAEPTPALLLLYHQALQRASDNDPHLTNIEHWTAPNPAIVRSLLVHGAQVNDRDAGNRSPLWYAVYFSNTDIVRLLLVRKADVEASSDAGGGVINTKNYFPIRPFVSQVTPLMWAIEWQRWNVVPLLLEHGANVSSKNSRGRTALDIIRDSSDPDVLKVIALLRRYGAK